MNKADKIFIGLIVVISCLLYVPSLWYAYQNQGLSLIHILLNVKENITLPLLLDQRKVNEDYFQKLVQQLGLQDRLNYLPNQLSGGQQQRVSICRAIMASPAVVLADEPTGNLDRKNSEEIVGLLKQLHLEQKQTLIMITHDESIALQADRILQICLLYTSTPANAYIP